MKRQIPDDLIKYIHEYIDHKGNHVIKFTKVLKEIIQHYNVNSIEIESLTELIIIILCIVVTALMPILHIKYSNTEQLNYFMFL